MNISFRRLHSEKDLNYFVLKYNESKLEQNLKTMQKDESNLPLDYLQKARVYGVFKKNEMVAGYVIGFKQPLRLFDFLLPESRQEVASRYQSILENCCEVTCAWRLPHISSVFMSFIFWPHAHFNAIKTGKKFFLGASANHHLDKMYTQAGPRTLYFGLVNYGLTVRIFFYTRIGLLKYTLRLMLIETPKRWLRKFKKNNL